MCLTLTRRAGARAGCARSTHPGGWGRRVGEAAAAEAIEWDVFFESALNQAHPHLNPTPSPLHPFTPPPLPSPLSADLAEAVAEGDRLVREYELKGEAACSVKELQECDSKIKKATADLVAETAELNARNSIVPGA